MSKVHDGDCGSSTTTIPPLDCAGQFCRINKALFGNGEPEHCLLVRVDQIERRVRSLHRIGMLTLGFVLTLAGTSIWQLLLRMGTHVAAADGTLVSAARAAIP